MSNLCPVSELRSDGLVRRYLQIQEASIHVFCVIPSLLRANICDCNTVPDEPKAADRVQTYRAKQAWMVQEKGMSVKGASKISLEQVAEKEFWVLTHPEESKTVMTARALLLELSGALTELAGMEGGLLPPFRDVGCLSPTLNMKDVFLF